MVATKLSRPCVRVGETSDLHTSVTWIQPMYTRPKRPHALLSDAGEHGVALAVGLKELLRHFLEDRPVQHSTAYVGSFSEGSATMSNSRRERVWQTIEGVMGGDEFLCSETISLADLHLIPILDYFARTDDGRTALGRSPRLSAWWSRIEQRPSVVRTRPNLG